VIQARFRRLERDSAAPLPSSKIASASTESLNPPPGWDQLAPFHRAMQFAATPFAIVRDAG